MLLPVFAVVLVFLTARTLWFDPPPRVTLHGETMGTTWAVTLNAPGLDRTRQGELRLAIQAELDEVDAAMSTWRAESEVSRFNAHRSDTPFAVSPETQQVVARSLELQRQSEGALNIQVRPLLRLWGFGSGARVPGDLPDPDEVAGALALVGASLRTGSAESSRGGPGPWLAKERAEAEIDLSAVAKGHGVDRVVDRLRSEGIGNALVEVGGEIRVVGERPDGRAWRVAIERPDVDGRAIHAVVEPDAARPAMATTGDYRSFYEAGGRRLTHIIDPRTGEPVTHGLASVSVVAETAERADGWATALMVLGPVEGKTVALRHDVAAYFIVRDADGATTTVQTPAFPPVRGAAELRSEAASGPADDVADQAS